MAADGGAVTDVLLLDFNGVVVDDEPIHFAALRDVLGPEGIVVDEATYYADYLGYDDRVCIREAFRRSGRALDRPVLDRLAAEKAARYAATTTTALPVVPGVREFVRAAAADARIAVVSGALRREIHAGLERAGLADVVACVVSAEDVTRCKPDPEGHRRALSAVAGTAGRVRAVVVEDSAPGIAAARAIGAGCAVLTTSHAPEDLAAADLVWESFEGHRPAELWALLREVVKAGRA
jgi:HAD superfamily hydrolase (TIGR01509 family)